MRARVERFIGYYASSHWFQVGILFVLVGIFALWLLWALEDARERADRQMVDLTVRNMRTGMQFALGAALMHLSNQRVVEGWVGANPVDWLAAPPQGYRGECSAAESKALPSRSWCFDRESRQLAYRPGRTEHLRATVGTMFCEELRWRVVGVSNGVNGGAIGLRIEQATPCSWFLE